MSDSEESEPDVASALRDLRVTRAAAEVVLHRRARSLHLLRVLVFVGVGIALFAAARWFETTAGERVDGAIVAAESSDPRAGERPDYLPPKVVAPSGNGQGAAVAVADKDMAEPEGSAEPAAEEEPVTVDAEEPLAAAATRSRPDRRARRYVAARPQSRAPGVVRWEDGSRAYRRMERRFRTGSRPMLVYVHTDWCSVCAQVDRALWSDGEVAQVANTVFTAIRINPEDSTDDLVISRTLGTQGYPSIFVRRSPTATPVRIRPFAAGRLVSAAAFAQALRTEAGW